MNILDKIARVDDGHEIDPEAVLESLHRGLHDRHQLSHVELVEAMLLIARLARTKH